MGLWVGAVKHNANVHEPMEGGCRRIDEESPECQVVDFALALVEQGHVLKMKIWVVLDAELFLVKGLAGREGAHGPSCGATDLGCLLEHHHFHAPLTCMDGGREPRATGSDHDQIKGVELGIHGACLCSEIN